MNTTSFATLLTWQDRTLDAWTRARTRSERRRLRAVLDEIAARVLAEARRRVGTAGAIRGNGVFAASQAVVFVGKNWLGN